MREIIVVVVVLVEEVFVVEDMTAVGAVGAMREVLLLHLRLLTVWV